MHLNSVSFVYINERFMRNQRMHAPAPIHKEDTSNCSFVFDTLPWYMILHFIIVVVVSAIYVSFNYSHR